MSSSKRTRYRPARAVPIILAVLGTLVPAALAGPILPPVMIPELPAAAVPAKPPVLPEETAPPGEPARPEAPAISRESAPLQETAGPAADGPAEELPEAPEEKDAYRIGIGDRLTLSVWQDTELTRTLTVLPDGCIHFPLVGEVRADTLTVAQLTRAVKQGLQDYVRDCELTITVDSAASMQIYVIGKVNRPGAFALTGRVNALQAISLAGGVSPYADRDAIKIFRQAGPPAQVLDMDYDAVTQEGDAAENIILERGDVVVVP